MTTAIDAAELVVLARADAQVAARARITGKYSGLAPAITALTATFSTVYCQASRVEVGRMWPTTVSGLRLVPSSIASTRFSVGRMIGSMSVQRFSTKSWCRFSSLSGSTKRGVERSKACVRVSSVEGARVSAAMTSPMKGRPVMSSGPST